MNMMRSLLAAALVLAMVSCAGPSRRDTLKMPYDDRIKLASIYIQGGQEDKAVPILKDALLQDSSRSEAWAMLGELYWLRGDFRASSKHLEKALDAGGDDAVILNNLAWVESARGQLEKALIFSDRAIVMDPVPLYPYLETRARILLKLGRFGEAAADARAALAVTPEHDREMMEQLEELIREIDGLTGGQSPP